VVVQPGHGALDVPVQIGENEITLEVIEKPAMAVIPNGDIRPLCLACKAKDKGITVLHNSAGQSYLSFGYEAT